MATEIELKLSIVGEHDEDALIQVKNFLTSLYVDQKLLKYKLENAYYDSPDLQLNKEKIALRIRKKGNRYIQTLKTKGQSVNGLSKRGEWEWDLTQPKLNLDYLAQCDAWPKTVNTRQLNKVFETNFTRHQVEFTWKEATIELALDQGEITSHGSKASINELELELVSGNENDLHLLYEELQKYMTLQPSDISKAERGYRLGKAAL
ncbi:MAG: inorganic triphosphatase YgiF [Oleiphilaceae bacterium]